MAISIFRKLFFFIAFISTGVSIGFAQDISPVNEQQLENATENNSDADIDDDSYLQEMQQFLKNPVNLNFADETELRQLKVLTPLQIQNLITYRRLLGNFISIYELQAIPSWNVNLINKILPYITISSGIDVLASLKQRFTGGDHVLLLRYVQNLERSKGYLLDSSTATNYYRGSPQKIFLRYKYFYKNLMQYGFTAEKDAGEQFFKGSQKQGFDFYSAHFFIRNAGIVKAFALGDYTISLGQGLIQWQGLAFKKSSDVMNIKRQAATVRPYNSAGEIFFHRGAAITLEKNYWETTAFISYRKLDANFISDTLNEDYVSSFQISGLHRTNSELSDKNVQTQIAFGGNISYSKNKLHVGINGIQYHFKMPLHKSSELYNLYALSGNKLGNYSIDYSYTYHNLHLFGEVAVDDQLNKAFITGLLMSVNAKVDVSFLYRNISKAYRSLYTNAFTENTYPNNEAGFYTGISINPGGKLRLDAYADIYKFPWLKYRVDAPSAGNDYMVQLTYTPDKKVQIYSRFHSEHKGLNIIDNSNPFHNVQITPKENWRLHFSYKINDAFTFRSRVEMQWYDKSNVGSEHGFLTYADVIYKSKMNQFSGNCRFQYFDTDGYNSRVYAYENDILYSYSIPVFYDKGYRYYLNINYNLNKHIQLWGRFAQTLYPQKVILGSGLEEIKGNRKTEIKIQLLFKII